MIPESSEDHKFSWGDTVIIKKSAPPHLHPGEIVSICSVIKIDPEDVKKDPSLIEPTWLYTLEFGDGSTIELPECFLEKYEGENKLNSVGNSKFDWGETVKIIDKAPLDFHPGEIVSICGITKIDTEKLAKKYKSNIGEWVYTIEYIGGADTEIPERYLEKYEFEK